MKKTVIILSILALSVSSCGGQTRKKQTKIQNSTTMEQIQNNYLNEEWYFETNVDKNLITISHTFDESGKYECRRSETHEHYHEKANGTYFFQPETNEIFIHIEENWIGSVVMDVWIQKDYKQYFLILEMTDSTVKVRTIPSEYELDWFIEKGRYYIKIINTDQDFDEFPPFEEKPKYYKRILKK